MALIPVADLIADFQLMLREHWKYTAGGASYGDVDCSGAFVWAYRQHGHSIYHGSNRMARYEVQRLIPISEATVVPGMAAFKFYPPSSSKYSLPSDYRVGGNYYNGDLNDYYHVGLVDTDTSRVLNAQSTSTGFVSSAITQNWPYVAYLTQVDYGTTPEPGPEPSEGVIQNVRWYNKPIGRYERETQEAFNNAAMCYNVLHPLGWTLNAVCGLLGSIEVESVYNPWYWESGRILSYTDEETIRTSRRHGYGLVQFTPPGKYIQDANAQALPDYGPNYSDREGSQNDGTAQLQFIDAYGDYYRTDEYPINFSAFKESTETPEYLARAWVWNYERPNDYYASLNQRQEAARYWYGVLEKAIEKGPEPEPHPPGERKGTPLWMLLWPY